MSDKRILIAVDDLYKKAHPGLAPLRQAGYVLSFNSKGRAFTKAELIDALEGVSATMAGGEPYDAEVFKCRPELKVVARMGVGHDKIDLAAAREHGVKVVMAYGSNHDSVADYTIGMILSLGLALVEHDRRMRAGEWQMPFHSGVNRKTLGLVGLGRIGRAVARRASGFGMTVLATDPGIDSVLAETMGVELTGLYQVLKRSDYLSLHLPFSEGSRNMIGAKELAMMKPTAYLVSTARGGQIDEAALIEALNSGKLAGAGLDVWAQEPLPADSPLFGAKNLLMSPHCSGMDIDGVERMIDVTVENILGALEDPTKIGPNLLR